MLSYLRIFSLDNSFDRPPGQEQPSLLDYSQQQGGGSCLSEGGRNGGKVTLPVEATVPVPRAEEGCLAGIGGNGELTDTSITSESGTEGSAEEDIGRPDDETAPSRRRDRRDNTKSPTADSTTVLPNSGGAEDDTSGAPQTGVEARRNPTELQEGGGAGWGGGAAAGSGSDFPLDGIAAKVKTRHSPRRKLPAYLSASPDGLGAASRWGALSKAHLEFHRLGTAGKCRGEREQG